jgi:hypothetical protein
MWQSRSQNKQFVTQRPEAAQIFDFAHGRSNTATEWILHGHQQTLRKLHEQLR